MAHRDPALFAFLPDNTVGQFLNAYPESLHWFRAQGCLDDGAITLPVADCLGPTVGDRLVDLALTVRMTPWQGDPDRFCGGITIDELVDHLQDQHHAYTRAELGRLALVADHIRRHGADTPLDWFRAFDRLRRHLLAHLAEEEELLFPACRKLERTAQRRPISSEACQHELLVMEHGHAEVQRELEDLRSRLDEVVWPEPIATAGGILVAGVRDLIEDVAVHSYKEDEYLLPATIYADELFDSRSRARSRGDHPHTHVRDPWPVEDAEDD